MDRRASDALYLVAILAAVLALAWHCASYLPLVVDDALISLRYADRLLHGHGLTWTDGEAVEGYSDLLWVLACAGVGALGVDLIHAAWIVGAASALAVVGAVVFAARDARPSAPLAVGLLAASGTFAVWTVAGLEAPLFAACIAWGTVLFLRAQDEDFASRRTLMFAGIAFALAALTRPEGVSFVSGGLVVLARDRTAARTKRMVALGSPVLAAYLGQLAFRWVYYQDIVPNSAHVKLAFTMRHLAQGAQYLGTGAVEAIGLVALGAAALIFAMRSDEHRSRALVVIVPLILWCAYVLVVGGDLMPARRHFVPIVVLLVLGFVVGSRAYLAGRARFDVQRYVGISLAGIAVLAFAQTHVHEITQVRQERWEWDGRPVGAMLRSAFGPHALIAVDTAGALPYFSRLPAIDMLGLNDRHIGSAPMPDFGEGPLGHERGDGPYVLGRRPDVVMFCSPTGQRAPCFRSGRQMIADPRFAAGYRTVLVSLDDVERQIVLYARVDGDVAGVRTEGSTIVVPAYLFASSAPHVARLRGDGRLQLQLGARSGSTIAALRVPSDGTWIAEARGPDRDVSARVVPVRPGIVSLSLTSPHTARVDDVMLTHL